MPSGAVPSGAVPSGALALDLAGSVELAVVERSGFPESRHLGAVVRVDAAGNVAEAHGDSGALVYPRSAAKPLQALAMLRLGAGLDGERLAIAMASHAGRPEQVALVERVLAAAGLTVEALRCPAAWPRQPAVIRGLDRPERVTMTCSGKHAGFLAASVAAHADPGGYLDGSHPVQVEVARVLEEFAGEPVAHWGVDGCLAPTPVLTLAGFARAIGRAVRDEPRLLAAARQAPWAIDEPDGENAVVIEETGALAKTGAEGVLVVALASGDTVAVKVLDGSARPATPVALAVLERAELIPHDAAERARRRGAMGDVTVTL